MQYYTNKKFDVVNVFYKCMSLVSICQLVPNDTKAGLNAARMMISVCQFSV